MLGATKSNPSEALPAPNAIQTLDVHPTLYSVLTCFQNVIKPLWSTRQKNRKILPNHGASINFLSLATKSRKSWNCSSSAGKQKPASFLWIECDDVLSKTEK